MIRQAFAHIEIKKGGESTGGTWAQPGHWHGCHRCHGGVAVAAVTATRCVRAPDPLRTCKSSSWMMSCANAAEDHNLSLQLASLAEPQFLSEALRYNPCEVCKVCSTFVLESQSLWWMIYVCLLSCCNALRDVRFWIHLCEMRDQPRTVLTIRKTLCILNLSESLLSIHFFPYIKQKIVYNN